MGLRDSKEDTYASQQCPLTNNRPKNKIKWEQKKAAPVLLSLQPIYHNINDTGM